MLKNTFCHIPGIGLVKERNLWAAGIRSWDALLNAGAVDLPQVRVTALSDYIRESYQYLEADEPRYFAGTLPADQHWRMFPDFRHTIAYLDIETTGLGYGDHITTIAVYDGQSVFLYVQNQNLNDFVEDIKRYKLLVTYNGKCFDIPFIENHFGVRMTQAHIDLRYVLASLGYRGGLKGCERQFGIDRKDLAEVDGFFAVLLWDDYKRNQNEKALQTLLAYNVQDVLNLETLLTLAYNLKLQETPFSESHRLPLLEPFANPFQPDKATIDRIRRDNFWMFSRSRYHWR